MFRMDCGCYYNSVGFKVGRKYLYEIKAYTGKIIKKIELTEGIIEKLSIIKDKYYYLDVRRTFEVLKLIDDDDYDSYDDYMC